MLANNPGTQGHAVEDEEPYLQIPVVSMLPDHLAWCQSKLAGTLSDKTLIRPPKQWRKLLQDEIRLDSIRLVTEFKHFWSWCT
jgi:hypothetical protein